MNDAKARARAHANQLTGSLHLLDVPVGSLSKHILQSRLPLGFLPSFIHEATHFWCLASDLGSALALLEMRLHRQIHGGATDGLRRDSAAVDIANRILLPVLEGMALFAEFDSQPGKGGVWLDPTYWAGRLFVPIDEDMPKMIDAPAIIKWTQDSILSAIMRYRTSQPARRRKVDVLMTPLLDSPHDYLLGYLAIKQTWRFAVSHTNAFVDRDLFLSFLKDWIFQDWVLIDYILDQNLSLGALAYLLIERFQERMGELTTVSLDAEVANYNREIDKGTRNPATMLASLHLQQYEAEPGQDRMRTHMEEIRAGLAGQDKDRYFADYATIEHRHKMMRLALEEVRIQVNEFNRVHVWRKDASGMNNHTPDGMYLSGEAPEGAEPGITDGWLAAYFLPAKMRTVLVACREDQPMLVAPPQGFSTEELDEIRFFTTKVITSEQHRQRLSALVREIVDRRRPPDEAETIASFPMYVRKLFANLALNNLDDGHFELAKGTLARQGFYDVLDRDPELLTAIVEISLLPAAMGHEHLREAISSLGFDLDSVLKKTDDIEQRLGIRILEPIGPALLCHV